MCKISFGWILQDAIEDKSSLVQVMAWCHQATSHYLNQCWPSSMLPYDVSRGYHINECVNLSSNWSLNPTVIHLNSNLSWWCWFHTTETYCGGWYPSDLAPGHQQPLCWPRPEHNARHSPLLTHWGRDKIAAILQTTFSNAFSSLKIYDFCLIFHWSLFLRFQWTIFQHWFG